MSDLITPDDLPVWVPGETTVDSAPLRWEGVRIRGFRYTPLDVPIPGIRDYMIVAYKDGATTMNRRCTGDWRNERVAPGCVSLLTHAAQSHWRWSEDVEVTHLYLSPGTMAEVAAEAYERHVKDVELRDVLKADDPVLMGIAASLAREAQEAGLGGRLYVESLRNHACVHILRSYANVIFRESSRSGGLSRAQCQLLHQYFEENLDRTCRWRNLPASCSSACFISRANSALSSAARRMPTSCASALSAPRLNWPGGTFRSKSSQPTAASPTKAT